MLVVDVEVMLASTDQRFMLNCICSAAASCIFLIKYEKVLKVFGHFSKGMEINICGKWIEYPLWDHSFSTSAKFSEKLIFLTT